MAWRLLPLLSVLFCLPACVDSTLPDTNVQVFQTSDEVLAARRAGQVRRWKDTAIAILKIDRPDLSATPADNLRLNLQAGNFIRTIDLAPISDRLTAQPDRAQEILRRHLTDSLAIFDQERLASLPLHELQSLIRPALLSAAELEQHNNRLPPSAALHAVPVADTLYWSPALHSPNHNVIVPIGRLPLTAWNITPPALERLALANVHLPPDPFDITSFGPGGRVAQLKPTTDPAIILLPELLPAVRHAWNTTDSLALLATTPHNIRLLEARNKNLLDLLYPQWNRTIQDTPHPLTRRPLCITPDGIGLLNYSPPVSIHRLTTQPTTQPRPTTQPKPYIVR